MADSSRLQPAGRNHGGGLNSITEMKIIQPENPGASPPQANPQNTAPATKLTLLERDANALAYLNDLFAFESLGCGSRAAGANALAAMALTIANVSGGRVFFEDESAEVGTSLTIAGPLTDSVTRAILREPLQNQQNLNAHIADADAAKALATAKGNFNRAFDPSTLDTTPKFPELLNIVQDPSAFISTRRLLQPGELHGLNDLLSRPMVAATADTPAAVEAGLKLAHSGQLFVNVPVASAGHAATMAPSLLRTINGTSIGPDCRSVCGHVAASIDPGALAECLRTNNAAVGWLGKSIWLVDGDAVPQPVCLTNDVVSEPVSQPAVSEPAKTTPLDKLNRRYAAAIQDAMMHRIDYREPARDYLIDYRVWQTYLIPSLVKCEPDCPGITVAARWLYVSLEYGLSKLLTAPGFANVQNRISRFTVSALARHLVRRMIAARQTILATEEQTRMLVLAQRMAYKLEEGPADIRRLIRKTNKLTASACTGALHLLHDAGFARQDGSNWLLTRPASEFVIATKGVIDV